MAILNEHAEERYERDTFMLRADIDPLPFKDYESGMKLLIDCIHERIKTFRANQAAFENYAKDQGAKLKSEEKLNALNKLYIDWIKMNK